MAEKKDPKAERGQRSTPRGARSPQKEPAPVPEPPRPIRPQHEHEHEHEHAVPAPTPPPAHKPAPAPASAAAPPAHPAAPVAHDPAAPVRLWLPDGETWAVADGTTYRSDHGQPIHAHPRHAAELRQRGAKEAD